MIAMVGSACANLVVYMVDTIVLLIRMHILKQWWHEWQPCYGSFKGPVDICNNSLFALQPWNGSIYVYTYIGVYLKNFGAVCCMYFEGGVLGTIWQNVCWEGCGYNIFSIWPWKSDVCVFKGLLGLFKRSFEISMTACQLMSLGIFPQVKIRKWIL